MTQKLCERTALILLVTKPLEIRMGLCNHPLSRDKSHEQNWEFQSQMNDLDFRSRENINSTKIARDLPSQTTLSAHTQEGQYAFKKHLGDILSRDHTCGKNKQSGPSYVLEYL